MKNICIIAIIALLSASLRAQSDPEKNIRYDGDVTADSPKLHRASSTDPLIPLWAQQKQMGTWVGIAPPTSDEKKGRTIALINAMLGYLRSQQTGKIMVVAESSTDITEKAFPEEQRAESKTQQSIKIAEAIDYSSFDIKVIDEYYNSRGEYFVNCRLSENRLSTNKLTISKTDSSTDLGDNHFQQLKTEVNIVAEVGNEHYSCSYTCKSTGNEISECLVSIDGVPIRNSKNLKYDAVVWDGELNQDELRFTQQELASSLGLLQLSSYVLVPFIPQKLTIMTAESSSMSSLGTGAHQESRRKIVGNMMAETSCHATEIIFSEIYNGQLKTKVFDTNMEDANHLVKDYIFNEVQDNLLLTPIINYPRNNQNSGLYQLLQTNSSFYQGLSMIALEIRTKISASEKMNINISSAQTTDAIPDYSSNSSLSLENIGVHWKFLPISAGSKKRNKRSSFDIHIPSLIKVGIKETK